MTHEEVKKNIHDGIKMIFDQMEQIGREKHAWSLCELGEASDILKDISKAHKNLAKAHYYMSEHSDERY